jgi:hypothetical protein
MDHLKKDDMLRTRLAELRMLILDEGEPAFLRLALAGPHMS